MFDELMQQLEGMLGVVIDRIKAGDNTELLALSQLVFAEHDNIKIASRTDSSGNTNI